jgi:hypothetical protein
MRHHRQPLLRPNITPSMPQSLQVLRLGLPSFPRTLLHAPKQDSRAKTKERAVAVIRRHQTDEKRIDIVPTSSSRFPAFCPFQYLRTARCCTTLPVPRHHGQATADCWLWWSLSMPRLARQSAERPDTGIRIFGMANWHSIIEMARECADAMMHTKVQRGRRSFVLCSPFPPIPPPFPLLKLSAGAAQEGFSSRTWQYQGVSENAYHQLIRGGTAVPPRGRSQLLHTSDGNSQCGNPDHIVRYVPRHLWTNE